MTATRNRPRGGVLVESAIVTSFMMLVLLATLRLGIVGYYTMQADAAAFQHAHETALNVPDPTARTHVEGNYSGIQDNDISQSPPQPAPAPSMPVDYSYQNTGNRHGGASMILSTQVQSIVKKKNIVDIPGIGPISAIGSAIEPRNQENALDFNIFGDTLPLAMFSDRVDYFVQGENAPPYFLGFIRMRECLAWDSSGNYCQSDLYPALGLAEFLGGGPPENLQNNYARAQNGIGSANNPTGIPNAVFEEAGIHQRCFAALATVLSNNPAYPSDKVAFMAALQPHYGVINSWDNPLPGGYPLNEIVPGAYPMFSWRRGVDVNGNATC